MIAPPFAGARKPKHGHGWLAPRFARGNDARRGHGVPLIDKRARRLGRKLLRLHPAITLADIDDLALWLQERAGQDWRAVIQKCGRCGGWVCAKRPYWTKPSKQPPT